MIDCDTKRKPLLLSEVETVALLDLCLPVLSRADAAQERAIQKLLALAHCGWREPEEAERPSRAVASFDRAPSGAALHGGRSEGVSGDYEEAVVDRILASICA